MSDAAACEVCGSQPAYDALTAWLCVPCIDLQATLSPDALEHRGKQLPRGSQERRALIVAANWQRQVFTQPRAR